MTQAYNLAILANAVNTSGQLNVGTNATGTLPLANGGTGTTNTVNTVVAGTGISVSTSGTQVTVSTSGAGGVTSLNGETGAITNTTFGVIGSYFAPAIPVVYSQTYSAGNTRAGSTLRYPINSGGGDNVWGLRNEITMNDGGSYANPSLTGTWRIMGYAKSSTGTDNHQAGCGLWVRIS
jgi:hypothetical protein